MYSINRVQKLAKLNKKRGKELREATSPNTQKVL
jgi:hypothetical protein